MAPDSGIEATMPCFHGVSSPGHPEGRVQVVVPQDDRECASDKFSGSNQVGCFGSWWNQKCNMVKQLVYIKGMHECKGGYLPDTHDQVFIMDVVCL